MDYILLFRHINGVDNIPADALSRGINSFLLEPSIDIHTFSKEQRKYLQRLIREKNSVASSTNQLPQQRKKDHLWHKHGQVTSVRTCIFMQRHFYRGA